MSPCFWYSRPSSSCAATTKVSGPCGFHIEDLLEILLRFGEASGLQVGHAPDEENAGAGAGVEGGGVFEVNGLGGVGFGGIGGE